MHQVSDPSSVVECSEIECPDPFVAVECPKTECPETECPEPPVVVQCPDPSELELSDWSSGIEHERTFWDQWLASEGSNIYHEDFMERNRKERMLTSHHADVLSRTANPDRHVRILDVGSGPLSAFGNMHESFQVELLAVDPLAPLYDELLAKHNIQPYPRAQYVMSEELHMHFAHNFFDLVHMRNALDHAADPLQAIRSMLKVLKPGCSIMLGHSRNEAMKENWRGFHQWNFDYSPSLSSFIITGSDNVTINVDESLDGLATVQTVLEEDGLGIANLITKHVTI